MNFAARAHVLTLLAAAPLLFSAPTQAGSPFGPAGYDTSIDLSAFGAKFPKRDKENREGEILVKFKDSVPQATRDAKHATLGNTKLRELKRSGVHHVRVTPDQTLEQALANYTSDSIVEYAEPNYAVMAMRLPNEPAFNLLWGMQNTGQTLGTLGADIKATLAWDLSIGSAEVAVMVIDSGIDYTHPDLAANIFVNLGETPGDGIDNDGNGYIDDVHGIDLVNGDSDPRDDFGHGTHVAGTVGAVGNNSLGVVGVNWNVKLIPCKILDAAGNGTIADAVTCLEYARKLKASGVNIVATNNSYGVLGGFSQTMYNEINAQRDILFVAAAGNSTNDNDAAAFYPAGFELPNVISVAATDHNDAMAGFSNFGRRSVHVGAPGANIWSTTPFSNYLSANGTSMAAPHVAGVAALLKAHDPARDWRAIRNLILAGGETKPALVGQTVTGRRLDAFGAAACSDRPLFSVLKLPAAFTLNVQATVSVQSSNCATPVGPVTGLSSAGQGFTLADDGVDPDLAAGDGIYTANWTPTVAFSSVTFSSPIGSEQIDMLDLSVAGVTGPASANRGELITVEVTVANPSSMAAPASSLNLVLSGDIIINGTDILLGSFPTPALAAGAQEVVTVTALIPTTLTQGNYFLGAIVDPANQLDEGDETNNARAGNMIAVGIVPVDLKVTSLSGPAAANTGDVINVSATVANVGTAAAPASTMYLFMASDPTVSTTYTLIGSPAVGALAGGASQVVSGPYQIPVTLPAGTYWFVAVADGPKAVDEIDENNNVLQGNSITTTTQAIDLILTAASGPSSANDGASISLGATVKNQGSVSAPATSVTWVLSTPTGDVVLGNAVTRSLNGGRSQKVSTTASVPDTVLAGTYNLRAIVDAENLIAETSDANNVFNIGTLAVSYNVDLAMTAVSGPTAAATGQTVTFNGTVTNGRTATPTGTMVGFYLSTDAVITTADTLVATALIPALGKNASVPVSATAALNTSLAAGNYYVGAIVDPDALIAESDEANNARAGNMIAVTYGPDLVMTSVAAPSSVTRGETVTVEFVVANVGSGDVGALTDQGALAKPVPPVSVGIYLSNNSTVTANDRLIGTYEIGSLPQGTSITIQLPVVIPQQGNLKPGNYWIGAIADYLNGLHERDEGNNATAGNSVQVQ